MIFGYESWIASRYVGSRNKNGFISLISAISMFGIAIAVAVLIIVLSVVNGFERELKDRLLAMSAHANVESSDASLDDWFSWLSTIEGHEQVTAAAPYVTGRGLVGLGDEVTGVELRGIDPERESLVSDVANTLLHGDLGSLQAGSYNIVLGSELADKLSASIGDVVNVTLAEGIVTLTGIIPRNRSFTVTGIYRVGMYEFDRRLAFISMRDAQRLFRLGEAVTGVRISVTDIFDAPGIVQEVALAGGGGVLVSDWTRSHVNFFRSIQITKSILFVIMLMVIAVATFNIVSTLVMVVKDKQSDIAILRTFGTSPQSILLVYVTQGTVIGAVGTLLGMIFGVLFTLNIENIVEFMEATFGITFLASEVYFISDLPAELRAIDVITICSIALVLAIVSTVYPAWRGAKTIPAEALRYD
ncbi:MAG: lipoprotein-releasing system transmembrane subunit LolC [Woeseia sp.]|nr:lipoprotein-releasing system transmembrane subunit LolC [Woeseia sp.]